MQAIELALCLSRQTRELDCSAIFLPQCAFDARGWRRRVGEGSSRRMRFRKIIRHARVQDVEDGLSGFPHVILDQAYA